MPSLQELRALLGAQESFSPRKYFPFSLLESGLTRGKLTEISGRGKTECVVRFLAENPGQPVAWIEENFSLFPTAIFQRLGTLEKILFIEGKKDSAWAASTILRSQLFPLLIYSASYREEKELRRFQLLAEKSETAMILLAEKPSGLWPIAQAFEMRKGKPFPLRRK